MVANDCLRVVALVFLVVVPACAQRSVPAVEAKDHVGEEATVCGKVVSARYFVSRPGRPTLLYLDRLSISGVQNRNLASCSSKVWGTRTYAQREVRLRDRKDHAGPTSTSN